MANDFSGAHPPGPKVTPITCRQVEISPYVDHGDLRFNGEGEDIDGIGPKAFTGRTFIILEINPFIGPGLFNRYGAFGVAFRTEGIGHGGSPFHRGENYSLTFWRERWTRCRRTETRFRLFR